jgi:hypothetical protein
MKIENVSEGQVFKNYKEICLALCEPVKTGKSKQLQLDDWKRYFEYSKSGNSFIIIEIYETPMEKNDNRGKSEGSRRSIYGNAVQLLIVDLLARSHGHITISKNKLLLSIGVINVNYGGCSQQVKKLAKYVDINEKFIYDFYNVNNSNFTNMINSALNSLEDKSLIMYSKIIKVCEYGQYKTRKANKFEETKILECEKETLVELGFEEKSKIRVSNKWTEFKKKVNLKLSESTNIQYYYSAFEITVNKKFIEQERNKLADLLLEQVVKDEALQNLNSSIIEHFIDNSAERTKNESKSFKLSMIRFDFNYIEYMTQLATLLLDRNASNITHHVDRVKLEENTLSQRLIDDIEQIELFG